MNNKTQPGTIIFSLTVNIMSTYRAVNISERMVATLLLSFIDKPSYQ
jgi:hypothetical protein